MDKERVNKVRAKFSAAYGRYLKNSVQDFHDNELKRGMGPDVSMDPEMLLVLLTRLGLRGVERMAEAAGASTVAVLLQQEMRGAMAELMLVDPEFGQTVGEEILGSLRDQLGKELAATEEKPAATTQRALKPRAQREPESKTQKGFSQLGEALKKAGVVR